MSEDPDLQRRLEAMFASVRPRRQFEHELWRRIEKSRPWHQRLTIALRPALRFAPALAALLVVALGASWLVGNHGLLGGGTTTSSSAGSAAYGPQKSSVAPGLGQLPPLASSPEGTAAPQAPVAGNADATAGLTFNGTLPSLPLLLPIYRYDEPSASDLAAAAARLRAQAGIPVSVAPSNLASGLEPSFSASGAAPSAPLGGPIETASAFLASHGLTPSFAFQASLAASGRQVDYGRLFDGPDGPIPEVRRTGSPAGLSVDLGSAVVRVSGPLDLPFASAPYPLRSATAALGAAGVRTTAGPAAFNRAQIVYLLVISGGHGYYEPALLLVGPGGSILAPVVAQAWVAG